MVTLGHTVTERWLRERLIAIRGELGLTQDEAARKAGYVRRTLNRLESGATRITTGNIAVLCDAYEVSREVRDELRQLRERAAAQGWWDAHADWMPRVYAEHCELEQEADRINVASTQVIPGFVQTEAYARFIQRLAVANNTGDAVETFVQIRLERQRRAFARQRPIRVLLDEAVIRCNAGPGVMAAQVDHLLQLEVDGRLQTRVLPFEVEHLFTASFQLFGIGHKRVVCLDGALFEEHTESEASLNKLSLAFEAAWEKSVPLQDVKEVNGGR
jgi:transcriptional regulator with XRE-family HTH domain